MADADQERWVRGLSWGDRYNTWEVSLHEQHLEWTWLGPKDLGGSSSQSYEDFWLDGPVEPSIPPQVLSQVSAAAAAKLGDRVRELAEVAAARRTVPEPASEPSPQQHDEALSPPSAPTGARMAASLSPPLRLWKVWLLGTVVFLVGVVPPVLLKPVLPGFSNFLGLIGTVLAGLVLGARSGSAGVVTAGFFAMAGAIGLLGAYDRALEVAGGPHVALDSVALAPRHVSATRFTFGDAQLRSELWGDSTSTSASGKRQTTWRHLAAPLVPSGWTVADPVPAWVVCTTTPGFNCLEAMPARLQGAVLAGETHGPSHAAAAKDAMARHGLSSAQGAPLLKPADEPDRQPVLLFAQGLMVVFGAWLAWAVAVGLARLWSRLRPR